MIAGLFVWFVWVLVGCWRANNRAGFYLCRVSKILKADPMGERSNEDIRTVGERISVVGCCGAGKSTLAKQIGARLGRGYINSDELFWLPDWVQRPKPEHRRLLTQAMAEASWVFDGNIRSTRDIVLPRIDTLIWLDYPRHRVMRQLLRRTFRRSLKQELLFAGNRESWRRSFASKDSILFFAWHAHANYRSRYTEMFADLPEHIRYPIRLTSPRQAEALVASL